MTDSSNKLNSLTWEGLVSLDGTEQYIGVPQGEKPAPPEFHFGNLSKYLKKTNKLFKELTVEELDEFRLYYDK